MTFRIIGWSVLAIVIAAAAACFIFYDFQNIALWAAMNNPIKNASTWVSVQLSDGEILYGHLTGVSDATLGLRDVYILQKFSPATPVVDPLATSTDFSLQDTPNVAPPAKYVPVRDAGLIVVSRASVLYFSWLASDDPALPYLK